MYWDAHETSNGKCECDKWYEWNFNKNYCVIARSNTWYWWTDFRDAKDIGDYIVKLLAYDEAHACDTYGPNSYLISNNMCACKSGFEWNNNNNYCVVDRNSKLYGWKDFRWAKDGIEYINMLLDFEDELERNKNNNKSQETPVNDTWLNKAPHKINEEESLFRTEKNKVKMEMPDDDDDLSWSMINLMHEWAIEAKNRLWDKTKTLDGIVESLLEKDQETQEKFVKTVLELQNDKDQYTADIWEYLKFTLLYRKI